MSSLTPHFLWFTCPYPLKVQASPTMRSQGRRISKVRCCGIHIHDVYVEWNIPCISYSYTCYYGHLWDFIWWYAPCSIYIHDVYVEWNIPCISYSYKCYYGHLWDLIWWYAHCTIYCQVYSSRYYTPAWVFLSHLIYYFFIQQLYYLLLMRFGPKIKIH